MIHQHSNHPNYFYDERLGESSSSLSHVHSYPSASASQALLGGDNANSDASESMIFPIGSDYHYYHRILAPLESNQLTQSQEITLTWVGRICSLLSVFGGVYIFYWAWRRKHHVYHRLMLALSVYLIFTKPWMVYGPAAIPEGTPDVWGAQGTTATCTAQGFFIQLGLAIPFYYVGLSFYSWVVIIHGNFDPKKYRWIEKYIHIVANGYAFGSALFLLRIEAFNHSGLTCWIASIPFGCGDGTDIECTRGPKEISKTLAFFVGIPALVVLVVPAVAMGALALYVCWNQRQMQQQTQLQQPQHPYRSPPRSTLPVVLDLGEEDDFPKRSEQTHSTSCISHENDDVIEPSNHQNSGNKNLDVATSPRRPSVRSEGSLGRISVDLPMRGITARKIVQQSAVYLAVSYFIYLPGLIQHGLGVFGKQKSFVVDVLSSSITGSMGIWFALVYRYFSTKGVTVESGNGASTKKATSSAESGSRTYGHNPNQAPNHNASATSIDLEGVFHSERGNGNGNGYPDDDDDANLDRTENGQSATGKEPPPDVVSPSSSSSSCPRLPTPSPPLQKRTPSSTNKPKTNSERYTFNIFDGTAPSNGHFSEFLFAGDDDDEEQDQFESKYWSSCQELR
mmetsp:Transcript_25812/g.60774  ORF Transcript_25812/g.60774 Transcript_25812/m.60774 type:complete len:622 (+) Transcript_25812:569-2434(+)